MVDKDQKIHLLCQELIVVMDELDPETQNIVRDHIKTCSECKELSETVIDSDLSFSDPLPNQSEEEIKIKPLKRLTQFHVGLRLFVIAIRILILFYIILPAVKYHDTESYWITFDYVHSGILLFYIPAALFLLVFSFIFLNKRWFWTSMIADLGVIFFLSYLLQLFL